MNGDDKFELLHHFQASQRQLLVQGRSVQHQPSFRSRPFAATIVSSSGEIAELARFVRSLAVEPGMLNPRFFLASVLPQSWRPCVVVVSQDQRIAGLLYCKERVVAGIGTGIVYGDDSLGVMVAAYPEETESVIRCAVEALLKHMVGLRFLVPPDRLPFLRGVQAAADVNFYRANHHHHHLELPRTYDEFLVKLGPRTRRNFRYYRRKSELAGNVFNSELAFPAFCAAARCLFPKAAYATSERDLERSLAMIEAMPSRTLVGLRRRGAEWISLAGGWHVSDRTILITQLNDRTCNRESVSLVLRSHLIEKEINRGCQELVFWAGASAPLSFHSASPVLLRAYIDVRSLPWRLCRLACATVSKLAPATFGRWLKWIVPDGGRTPAEPGFGKTPRAPRFHIEIPVSFRFLGEDSWNEAKTDNVSLTGVLFHAEQLGEGFAPIEIRFEQPAKFGGTGGVVICQGQIVRTMLPAATDARPSVAARFVESRPELGSLRDLRRLVCDDRGPLSNR